MPPVETVESARGRTGSGAAVAPQMGRSRVSRPSRGVASSRRSRNGCGPPETRREAVDVERGASRDHSSRNGDDWEAIAAGYDAFVTPSHMWVEGEGLRRAGVEPGARLLDVADDSFDRGAPVGPNSSGSPRWSTAPRSSPMPRSTPAPRPAGPPAYGWGSPAGVLAFQADMTPPPPTPPLVVVAHGSRDDRSAAAVGRLVSAARRRRPGIQIQQGFLDFSRPPVQDVLADLDGEIVVLPLLLTPAYHSRVDLPGVLAAHQEGRRLVGRTPLAVRYGATLGPDEALIAGMARRLAEAGVRPCDPGTALVLAAAGSSNPCGIALVQGIARRWAAEGWWDVVPAFASATGPTVTEAVAGLRARGAPRVVVASYFLAPGRLPDRVVRGAGDCVVAAPLDNAPEVAGLLLARYDEALAPGGANAGTARCQVLGDAARARCSLCRVAPAGGSPPP